MRSEIPTRLTVMKTLIRRIAAGMLVAEGVRLAAEAQGAIVEPGTVVMVEMSMAPITRTEMMVARIATASAVAVNGMAMVMMKITIITIQGTAGTARGPVIVGIEEIHRTTVREAQCPEMETAPGRPINRAMETTIHRLSGR